MTREAVDPYGGAVVNETGTREAIEPYSGVIMNETVVVVTFNAAFAINANVVIQPGARTG